MVGNGVGIMEVTVLNVDEVKKKLKEIQKFGDTEIMNGVGNTAVNLIKDRTLSGQDVEHNTFEGYSTYYKNKSGKGNPPDLKVSGTMLNAVKAKVIDSLTVIIRVVGEKAYNLGVIHQAGKENMPSRKWFGIEHDTDKKTVLEKFKKLLLAKVVKTWNK